MATKKSAPTESTAPAFVGFTPIAEARAVLLRLPHPDAHASSFMKGDLIERGHYASATVTGVYIVQGGYVVDLALTNGSTVTLFSNAEFSADIPEGA